MSDELKLAIEVAKAGAKYAFTFFGKNQRVEKKSDNTVVTKIDRQTEQIIKEKIREKLPNAKFVGEEGGGTPTKKGAFWTIDPIDGTRHFTRGTPLWSVLLALVINGKPEIGVSYTPCLNELLCGQRRKGAFLNDKKIHVSDTSSIKDALLMFESIRFFKDKSPLLKLIDACASSRSLVSPYEYHLLASGRCEIVLDAYGKIWDLAPFKVIVEEAGGKITKFNGDEWDMEGSGAIMTNGILHEEVIKILNEK